MHWAKACSQPFYAVLENTEAVMVLPNSKR